MLLAFLQVQRDAVLNTVAGLPEQYWQRPVDGDDDREPYDPFAAFTCPAPSAEIIAAYLGTCRRSDEILAATSLSARPLRPEAHEDPDYAAQVTDVRFVVLHVIEELAVHSGHLEIARELLDGQTRLSRR
jgi:hypothetical protein